ncbi:MAG: histidine phosphatase family protein [Gemmataceae bacterium]
MSRTVWLVRHPAVFDTYRGVCYGSSEVPLSPESVSQLQSLARNIQRLGPITHLYHSGLIRCAVLAETLAALTGLPATTDARLRERHFGQWEGRTWDEIHAETGDAMLGMVTAPDTWRPPGGETTFELRDRVLAWYAQLPTHATIVAITHGGPIAALLGTLQQRPVAQWPQLIPPYGACCRIESGQTT